MRRYRLATLLLTAVMLCGCGESVQKKEDGKAPEPSAYSLFAMDTYVTLTDYFGGGEKPLKAAADEIERLESLWSVNIEDSDIYRLNASGSAEVSDETAELLGFTLSMCERTGGSLDPTLFPVLREWGFTTGENHVPGDETIAELLENTGWQRVELDGSSVKLPEGMSIDLGAVAKGYTADLIAGKMKSEGISAGIVDLGGNILTFGKKPDGSKWKIAVRSPYGDGSVGTLTTDECSVVTSGGYERYFEQNGVRYHHILDPSTGRPADTGLESVTIISSESKLCDALSTAMFVKGEQAAADFWRVSDDFEMIMLTTDGRLLITEGVADSFSLNSYYSTLSVEKITR